MIFKTYIIIVTFNAKPWLKRCLDSINFNLYKVVVIDNNSTDDTISSIENKYSDVILFAQNSNLGFGQANNIGISYALNHGAEQVFLLNQDAYLVDDVIDKLIKFQSKHTEYGILSPIHINADKSKLDRNFSNFLRYEKNHHFYSDHVLGLKKQEVYDIPFVNAAGWLISKSCLMTVGGFDPLFYHYGEDNNYCQRMKYHRFKIGVLPNTYLIHDRENRKKSVPQLFSKAYYMAELRKFQVLHANVNNYNKLNILKYQKRFKKQLIKAYLKNDKMKIKNLKSHLKLVNNIIPQIENSVKINKKSQPSYLKIEN